MKWNSHDALMPLLGVETRKLIKETPIYNKYLF